MHPFLLVFLSSFVVSSLGAYLLKLWAISHASKGDQFASLLAGWFEYEWGVATGVAAATFVLASLIFTLMGPPPQREDFEGEE